MRYFSGSVVALAMTLASASHAAVSMSFAAGSSDVERFLEFRNIDNFQDIYMVDTGRPEVDLLVSGGDPFGLSSMRVGFQAEFQIRLEDATITRGASDPFATLVAPLRGEFVLVKLDGSFTLLLDVFIETGVGVLTGTFDDVTGQFRPIAGALLITSAVGVLDSGEELPTTAAFTLTNFEHVNEEGDDPTFAYASASFSGVLLPSPSTAVIAFATVIWGSRRRR